MEFVNLCDAGSARNLSNMTYSSAPFGISRLPSARERASKSGIDAALVRRAVAPAVVEMPQPRHLVAPLRERLLDAEPPRQRGEDRIIVARLADPRFKCSLPSDDGPLAGKRRPNTSRPGSQRAAPQRKRAPIFPWPLKTPMPPIFFSSAPAAKCRLRSSSNRCAGKGTKSTTGSDLENRRRNTSNRTNHFGWRFRTNVLATFCRLWLREKARSSTWRTIRTVLT